MWETVCYIQSLSKSMSLVFVIAADIDQGKQGIQGELTNTELSGLTVLTFRILRIKIRNMNLTFFEF